MKLGPGSQKNLLNSAILLNALGVPSSNVLSNQDFDQCLNRLALRIIPRLQYRHRKIPRTCFDGNQKKTHGDTGLQYREAGGLHS